MPLTGSIFQSTMLGELASKGFAGAQLVTMVTAVSSGSALSLVAKTFTTKDTGSITGAGVGIGVGIKGVTKSIISAAVFQELSASFGTVGEKLKDLCDGIGAGLEAELQLATLSSTHTLVFLGSAVIDPGSIPVSDSEWGSNIQSAGPLSGEKWPSTAKAIGKGCVSAFTSATGQLVISGAPIIPPPPSPGTGTGTGVVT